MYNPLHSTRLSVRQFLEAAGDDNRFYASRELSKPFDQVTIEECIAHYLKYAPIGQTVIGFDVAPAVPPDMCQLELFSPDVYERRHVVLSNIDRRAHVLPDRVPFADGAD